MNTSAQAQNDNQAAGKPACVLSSTVRPRRTPITVKGDFQAMLDEVDMVSSVSGGSFTALAEARCTATARLRNTSRVS